MGNEQSHIKQQQKDEPPQNPNQPQPLSLPQPPHSTQNPDNSNSEPITYNDPKTDPVSKVNLQIKISFKSITGQYFVDPINSIIHLPTAFEYVWIDLKVYSDEMARTLQRFTYGLEQFEEYDKVEEFLSKIDNHHGNTTLRVIASTALPQRLFKIMNRNRYIDRIILFSQNSPRVDYLKEKYLKILRHGTTRMQVLSFVRQPTRHRNNVLFMIQEDIPVISKYWISFHSLINYGERAQAKEHFLELVRALYPDQTKQIDQFDQEYRIEMEDEERIKLTKKWVFKDSFYWNVVTCLPKITNDPKKLAYLRLPFKDIYEVTKSSYLLLPQTQKERYRNIYIVQQLNSDQIEKIHQGQCSKNFLLFTTFVKAFTRENDALLYLSRIANTEKQGYIFSLDIPFRATMDKEFNFGFMVNKDGRTKWTTEPDVVINIYNYFKLDRVYRDSCQGHLIYGGLANCSYRRNDDKLRSGLTEKERKLLYFSSQNLIKCNRILNNKNVLMMSEHHQDLLQNCQSRILSIRERKGSEQQADKVHLQMAETLCSTRQYSTALETYSRVQTETLKVVARIRIIEILLLKKDYTNARVILQQIIKPKDLIEDLRDLPQYTEDYFRGRHLRNKLLMHAGNHEQACDNYQKLKEQVQKYCDCQVGTIPFWSDLIKNLEECKEKVNEKRKNIGQTVIEC